MGVANFLKDLVGIEDVDDEDLDEEEIEEASANLDRKALESKTSFMGNRDAKPIPIPPKPTGNTVSFKMVVIEPKSLEECPKLVDNLKAKKPVIINLEKVESGPARMIFDFLSGATYALNGTVQKITNNIFVFAPENVDISANVEQKNSDFVTISKSPWR